MKKVWLGLGTIVIIILLLLQTRFTEFLRLDYDGYAVEAGKLKQLLVMDPTEEDFVSEDVPFHEYKALDYVYQRGNSFYLGEKKKTQIDMDFPMLINDGAGILFTDNESTLFDVEFEQAGTYRGLMMNDKTAYNPDGERADANEYLFARLGNGFYSNLASVSLEEYGEMQEITPNSFICFREDYFTCYEPVNGIGVYKAYVNMNENDSIFVDGEEYTYRELLLLLEALTDHTKDKKEEETLEEEIPTLTEEEESLTEEESAPEEPEEESSEEESVKEPVEKEKPVKEKKPTPAKQPSEAKKPSSSSPSSPSKPSRPSGSKPGNKQEGSMGVRPDSARPDKNKGDKEEEKVEDYIKPEVTVNSMEAGIYRVLIDTQVDDPASRLHKLRKVQFEFYELADENDTTGTMVYRTYTASTKVVEAGSGSLKPGTRYRVNAYYTYYDEYNNVVVENIILPDDGIVTTGSHSELGEIVLLKGIQSTEEGNSIDYMSIPIYYDNKLVITNVAYDAVASDPEAIYAIDNAAGITIHVEGKNGSTFAMDCRIDKIEQSKFKNGTLTSFTTTGLLNPNTEYTYEIIANAFDGYELKIAEPNNAGEFRTCKSRPVGDITVAANKVADIKLDVVMTDPDDSAVKNPTSGEYEIYLVAATDKYNQPGGFTWDDCKAYLENGKRVAEDATVHFVHRFAPEDISVGNDGTIRISETVTANSLDLNTGYHVYLLCDFDLQNQAGVQEHGEVAYLKFTSASLSSLGNIYVYSDITDIAAHSANIWFELNENKTNEELVKLISSAVFNINDTENKTTDAVLDVADGGGIGAFTGYITNAQGEIEETTKSKIVFPSTMFVDDKYLKSMTEYEIEPVIKAVYNGKEYDMNVVLTKSKFKTLREPATITVENDLFAAGTLSFKVTVNDPDDAVCGNSGHMVVLNLYDYNRNFVRSVRIPKNTPVDQKFTGLDPAKQYFIDFIAVEYNEGYTNATYESNKVLYTHYFDSALDITGTIKLQNIRATMEAGKMTANTLVTIHDPVRVMNNEIPYLIRLEKDGVAESPEAFNSYTYDADNTIREEHAYKVDKGEHTYTLTLYIYYNNNELILDTLTFTTEDVVEGIANAQEFVKVMKESGGKGRYVITGDIDLGTTGTKYTVNGAAVYPYGLVSNFNGQIDFQGYTLSLNKTSNVAGIFNNIGPKGEIFNAVFDFKADTSTRIYENGMLCNTNYGHIHDVIANFKGGSNVTNQHFGMLCTTNATTGIIERFVVNNDPEEGKFPFVSRYMCGLAAARNYGLIRDGYAYGEDIYAATENTATSLYTGAIAGINYQTGQMENVYSLVNVIVSPAQSASKKNSYYASVTGSANGSVKNVYGIGQSTYTVPDYAGNTFDKDMVGSAVGAEADTQNLKNIYYWNEDNFEYQASKRQSLINLESLHDYSWQKLILGDAFDVQPVEVGFYPQVILNGELPEQELLPLPQRADANLAIMSANVLSYAEDGNSAEVEFRLSNTKNVWVDAITIDGLSVTLHTDSVVSADGFTTIKATVSEPTKFISNYEIVSAQYKDGNRTRTVTFNPKPILMVDFYRDIHNPDEWYEYVVKKPNENARLANDIDFAGVSYDRIQCTEYYNGKLSGGKNGDNPYGYTLRNISIPNRHQGYVFFVVQGEVKDLCVENLTIGTNRTSSHDYTGFIGLSRGTVQNVHLKDVTMCGDDYIAALIGYAHTNAVVRDCSATNVDITYREYGNIQTTANIGGLVGRLYNARMENCYVRNVNILASDLRNASGIGGVVGYADASVIDSVYATGDIESRVSRVGGIAGNYTFGAGGATIKNMIARVNVKGYQDIIGGLIGALNLTQKPLTAKNNITGVAFGNVSCSNTESQEVSYTTGWIVGNTGSLYGADFQLFNGILGTEKDKNTLDLISYEQATTPSVYTDENLLDMEKCYEYEWVADGYIPALYYSDGSGHLPFQAKDEPISLTKLSNNLIDITAIGVNKENGYIWMDVEGPAGYTIKEITIEDLLTRDLSYNERNGEDLTIPASGQARINVYYLEEVNQEHFLDSYNLVELKYISEDGTEAGRTDYSKAPIRVPLTLFKDIWDLQDWQEAFAGNDRNAGNYENYRIRDHISFATNINYAKNLKVGRLVGDVSGAEGGRANLTNITITDSSTNLIYRLNSELANLNFINCTVQTKGRDNVGLIGTSAASTHDVNFENISIAEVKGGGGRRYMGIIAYQDSGGVGYSDPADPDKGKVVLKNVSVGADVTNNTHVGGLTGYAQGGSTYKNIYAEDIQVYGKQYVGGILGQTGTIYMDGVEAKDVHVTGCSSTAGYVGGIIGHVNAGYVNSSGAHFVNIKLTGTPEYDDKGNIVDSTTVIAVDPGAANVNAIYVGGLFGYNGVRECGFIGTSTEKESLFAEGILVKGYGDYVGGIAGRGTVQNAVVKDSLITVSKAPDTVKKYMGGVAGYSNTPCKYTKAIRCEVRPINFSNVGLVTGCQMANTTSYMQAEDSILKAETVGLNDTQKAELQYYGGIFGRTEAAISYGTVYNCTVDAAEGSIVGGVVGYEQSGVIRCFYYAEPASEDSPTAKEQYYVKGKSLVGGLAGQNDYTGNNTQYSYSNANVIADGDYAGGLFGAYENDYSATLLNGSMRYTYADCRMNYNYFAGTVTAGNYAGGLIGRLGMTTVENEDHAKLGGRSIEAVSGSNNEKEYTQHNLMLAEYIKATKSDGEAYAVAGNYDGFEGKANIDYSGTVPDLVDKTELDKAAWTSMYAGTELITYTGATENRVRLYDMTNVDAPTHAKNSGTWRYKCFSDYQAVYPNDSNLSDSGVAPRANVRLLLQDDLEYLYVRDANGMAIPGGYRGIAWFGNQGWNGRDSKGDMRGDYYRMITKDVNYNSANMGSAVGADGLTDRQFYEGKAYLPHARINSVANPISDWLTKYQSAKRMALPVPQTGAPFEDRVFNVNGRRLSLRAPRTQTYAVVYQSDVDKINLEFSEDLVSGGYFILYCGDEEVERQPIEKRVYTYNYDFKDNLKLSYGFADGEEYTELEATDYNSRSLEHHVMTYGEKYYYIDDDGIWSGTGSSVSDEAEDGSREDASAELLPGNFITLYNGKALKTNGDVISMTTGETVRNVSGITPYEKDGKLLAMPLQSFVPADTEGITVESYTRFAEIISGAEIFAREEQLVRSAFDGSEAIIRSALTNVKDSVVLYNKDGSDYCTILGTDGIMIDMYNGDEMNAPEDFRFSGIVYMTNNMYTTAPFIVVEYQNGGMAGYNFMTGEYLFDHTVSNEMSLLDYVKVYFDGDKSELEGMSSTYASNAKLAEIAGTSERLLSMISGNNEDSSDTENNTKENTLKGENPEFAAKAKDGEIASNLANKDELPEFVPGADKGKYEDIEKDAGGTGDNDSPEASAFTLRPNVTDELNTTGTEGSKDQSGEEDDLLTDGPIVDAGDDTDITGGDKGGDGVSTGAGDIAGNGTGDDGGEAGIDLNDEAGEGTEGEAEDGDGEDAAEGEDADGEAEDGEGEDAEGEGVDAEGEDTDGEAEDGEGTDDGEGTTGKDSKTDEGKDDLLTEDELLETPEDTTDETNGSDKTADGLKEETTIVSTAGTEVTTTTVSNIKNKDVPEITSDETTSSNSSSTGNVNSSNNDLVTVYNMETGTYEIIDKTQYFTNKNYYSENVSLNIKNLSNVYNGFAEKEPEKKQADGLGLYIFVTLCALGGIGGTLWYRKKHKMRF